MISEGVCDIENWSNDAEDHRNKLHSKNIFKLFRIVIKCQDFYCIFIWFAEIDNI